ncbi:hypothetical protein SAMN05444166_6873 [Singulisphaera sp. GP187]|uniref:hypothetical protein n=1 Tax=Singulisphaera sp. GP187 TaxID=1882752 RepID=UPI000926532F|nr:hypothetical protein [Singulisphaera sp. GP187]SIO61842.1 hypothetical protein SAMN05444166_6873 [Singulisphaera sp. GP187]
MNMRNQFRPAMDSLEDRLALSTAMASVAQPSGHSPTVLQGVELTASASRSLTAKLTLSGTARGEYTSHQSQPDTGTTFQGTAKGKIAPLGHTSIIGSFLVPGLIQNGKVEGTVTLKSLRGSVTLNITAPGSTMISSLSHHFTYQIVSGTGQYHNAQGSGIVDVTLTPSTSHSSSPHHQFDTGKLSLMFASH